MLEKKQKKKATTYSLNSMLGTAKISYHGVYFFLSTCITALESRLAAPPSPLQSLKIERIERVTSASQSHLINKEERGISHAPGKRSGMRKRKERERKKKVTECAGVVVDLLRVGVQVRATVRCMQDMQGETELVRGFSLVQCSSVSGLEEAEMRGNKKRFFIFIFYFFFAWSTQLHA